MNLNFIQFLITVFWFIQISVSEDAPRVTTSYGQIKGFYGVSTGNRVYKAFTGIPYAKPPTEHRRFKAPEAIGPWGNELDATKSSKKCIQFSLLTKKVAGDEDCLYLNIYVPDVKNPSTLPVMFIIHGGAFQGGSNSEIIEKDLMDKDTIVVAPNYRLGALGFLSTGDEVVSGNMGLKDQSLALEWVSENIQYFGGDPRQVTLVGCSAGGVSVHYHYLSPLSAGLFQNGISMSGSALSPYAFTKNPMRDAIKLAEKLQCPTDNTVEMVRCLKQLPASELCKAGGKVLLGSNLPIYVDLPIFRPVAENIKKDYFINRSPKIILKSQDIHDVPWVTGIVSEEGIISTYGFILSESSMKYVDENWETVAPYILYLQDNMSKNKQVQVARLARDHYFGKESLDASDSTFKKFVKLAGDEVYGLTMLKAANLQAKANKSPVQMYYNSYKPSQSYTKILFRGSENANKNYGVCHYDDMLLIFKTLYTRAAPTEEDITVQQFLINMWYSLAKKGQVDVGVEWPKVNPSSKNLQYLHIAGPNNYIIENTDDFSAKKFWKSIGFSRN